MIQKSRDGMNELMADEALLVIRIRHAASFCCRRATWTWTLKLGHHKLPYTRESPRIDTSEAEDDGPWHAIGIINK